MFALILAALVALGTVLRFLLWLTATAIRAVVYVAAVAWFTARDVIAYHRDRTRG